MRKLNNYLRFGLALVALFFVLNEFVPQTPEFLSGMIFGIGLGLEILGIYAQNHDISKLRDFKRKLFKKLM